MEYKKDFKKWFLVKENINNKVRPPFEKLDVWWCYFGCNVGVEKDGKAGLFLRPVIVLDKINEESLIVVPLTTTIRMDNLHIPFYFNYNISVADIAHIRSIDSQRLHKKIGRVSFYVYEKIRKAIASRLVR